MDKVDEVSATRLEKLDEHLWYGDEWNLLLIEPEDLALPRSTQSLTLHGVGYDGGLMEVSRSIESQGELVVEYNFEASVEFSAVMSSEDALASGWSRERAVPNGFVTVKTRVPVTGTVGVEYEDDEDRGGIVYIRLQRGTTAGESERGFLSHVEVVREYRGD